MSDAGTADSERAGLEQTLQTALEAGVRVQMSGGYTARVYDTMDRIARAMGADRVEGSVTAAIVGLTVHRGGWSRTAFHRTPHIGVDFSELSALSQLTRDAPGLSPDGIRERLDAIEHTERRYPVGLVLPMLGVACAAFAVLFGSDAAGAAIAGLGGFAGALTRHLMVRRQFVPFIFCLAGALVSTTVVLLMSPVTGTSTQALAACVLWLVPGVPMLNGVADLLATHYLNGIVRLAMSAVIVFASGLGVSIALGLWGWLR